MSVSQAKKAFINSAHKSQGPLLLRRLRAGQVVQLDLGTFEKQLELQCEEAKRGNAWSLQSGIHTALGLQLVDQKGL